MTFVPLELAVSLCIARMKHTVCPIVGVLDIPLLQ